MSQMKRRGLFAALAASPLVAVSAVTRAEPSRLNGTRLIGRLPANEAIISMCAMGQRLYIATSGGIYAFGPDTEA